MTRRTSEQGWLATHRQRLAWVLVALTMAVVVGAVATAGILLHQAASLERQTFWTQSLEARLFEMDVLLARGGRPGVAAAEARSATVAAFGNLRSHHPVEAARLKPQYEDYVRQWSSAVRQLDARGSIAPAFEHRVDASLGSLLTVIDAQLAAEVHSTNTTNPDARLALIVALAAVATLVGVLIWEFQAERKAGRIDRDNAKRSEELIRLRDEFVASVSHELRTPLTSILGYLELIRDTAPRSPAAADDHLAVVQRNAERLLNVVGDLLLVAEADGGALSLDLREVDLGVLAADCVKAARPAADAKGLTLTLNNDSPSRLHGDGVRLAQMMDNIVSNAIKFTPAGGSVSVRTAADDGHAVFEVKDTGFGIAPADRAQLFTRFFRARTAAEQAIQGTGLGLTITKAIVDAHHGTIDVESDEHSGTTFHVELPVT